MKVSVCSTLTYFYTVDVPKKLCAKDSEGYLIHEADLIAKCSNADPISFSGLTDTATIDIVSIRAEDSDEEIYCG